ncbi:MbtH family protein [Actinoplanes subglobosus]|uniref:MbtH family protein n=1 Tax=Actinoplanes subglobosus TaxID=1547892 RepID=A0ABV8IQV6_9ACTN
MFDDDDGRIYEVVRNSAGQYSIWPADRSVPAGWDTAAHRGTKADCLAHISRVWPVPVPVGEGAR